MEQNMSPRQAREGAIQALRRWVQGLPEGAAKVEESEASHEYVIRVVPRNSRSADVTFRISDYGTFGLYIGAAIRIEDLPLSSEYVLEIAEAVRRGRFEEESWSRKGKLLKAIGVLRLGSGNLHGTEYRGALDTVGTDEHVVKRFEPYS